MSNITNRQAICDTLLKAAKNDKDIMVICSDSRGSASLTPFFNEFPEQSIEVGIAEQNLVSVAAGMAACGMKMFAASPASFISTRSYEQAKVDVAYSKTNVTLIGISGGISYGALGMTHHSCQDIAAMCALPDMRVYIPSDHFMTTKLIESLLQDEKPAYIRVSRSATEETYNENMEFVLDKANIPVNYGTDVILIAFGEMVHYMTDAAEILKEEGVLATVIDMYCLKPYDEESLLHYVKDTKLVVTAEEHSPFGGLGSLTAQVLSQKCPKRQLQIALPDGHIISGESKEVFAYYHMDGKGIAARVIEALK